MAQLRRCQAGARFTQLWKNPHSIGLFLQDHSLCRGFMVAPQHVSLPTEPARVVPPRSTLARQTIPQFKNRRHPAWRRAVPMPPLDPDVADLAPFEPALAAYDEQHSVTYLRLLDSRRRRSTFGSSAHPH